MEIVVALVHRADTALCIAPYGAHPYIRPEAEHGALVGDFAVDECATQLTVAFDEDA